jgi:uncharacterized Ntn-hydrolase superfamily protein
MLTLSLIARCQSTSKIGAISFADRRAIGSRLGRFRAGTGFCIVQGIPNPLHEKWALDLLSLGITPQEALISSTLRDKLKSRRQILLLGCDGHGDTYSGKKLPNQAKSIMGENYVAGGAGLNGAGGVDRLGKTFQETEQTDLLLENRLLGALDTTLLANRQVRGEPQSAALKVYDRNGACQIDLRVDSSAHPCIELRRLLDKSHLLSAEVTPDLSQPKRRENPHAA